MKRIIALIIASFLLILTGCGAELSPEARELRGRWAYNHDEETPILTLRGNGKAVYHGKNYTYTCDAEYIRLTSGDGEETSLRYYTDNGELFLYEHSVYTYKSAGEPKGLVGEWYCEDSKWSFEFTDNGTFMEDGYFPGYYSVDEAGGTFKLVYNDQFQDTVCYYRLDGNTLYLEYPWCMVKTK